MNPIAVSIERAAEMIDSSSSMVRSYIDQGLLPVIKLPSAKHPNEKSRRVLIAVSDLEKFVEQHRVTEPGR